MADADIIVVGAGPVGMLAALLSAQQGLSVLLLEQSATRRIQSRAIGITPPSLEILSSLGLAGAFIEQGVTVRVSEANGLRLRLGKIDFTGLQGDFPFVLSIPQDRTETLLEEAILADTSVRFLRGHQVTGCSEDEDHVVVSGECADNRDVSLHRPICACLRRWEEHRPGVSGNPLKRCAGPVHLSYG